MTEKHFRLSEVYLSAQGEGPRVGVPTVFVRFAGCNLRCPLWPCDSQYAIDPKYRGEWKDMSVFELYEEIVAASLDNPEVNICLTGGEVFLQNHELLRELVLELHLSGYSVEAFTNGTVPYPDWVREPVTSVAMVMDWKLPGSGELSHDNVRVANVREGKLGTGSVIKFTIANREDFEYAKVLYQEFNSYPVYYGVVWGKVSNEDLIDWVLSEKLPWMLTMQIHNYVWNREMRGI